MSIRLILFLVSLTYLAMLTSLGLFMRSEEHQISNLAIDMYDNVVKGVDYSNKALTGFVRFAESHRTASIMDEAGKAQLRKTLDTLDVAIQGAITDKTRDRAKTLRAKIEKLNDLSIGSTIPDSLTDIDAELANLRAKYANDELNYRIRADDLLDANDKSLKITLGIAVSIALLLMVFLPAIIIPPINRSVDVAMSIAAGNLDNPINHKKGLRELLRLSRALSEMQTSIRNNLRQIAEQNKTAEQAERDLKRKHDLELALSDFELQVSELLQVVSKDAHTMEELAEAMVGDSSDTVTNVKRTTLTTAVASSNVGAIASASEQLATSIASIASQMVVSGNIVQEAVNKAQVADSIVKQLSQSATRIQDIVGLIGKITGQINLLSLNATIESARAGDAGQGFAVVATEVKTLANQTSLATREISQQIQQITSVATSVVTVLTEIQEAIHAMDGVSYSIASDINSQEKATREISLNIQEASIKVQEVSANITQVGSKSEATSLNAHKVLESVRSFSNNSGKLNGQIVEFLRKIQALTIQEAMAVVSEEAPLPQAA